MMLTTTTTTMRRRCMALQRGLLSVVLLLHFVYSLMSVLAQEEEEEEAAAAAEAVDATMTAAEAVEEEEEEEAVVAEEEEGGGKQPQAEPHPTEMHDAREAAKPFYLKNMVIFGDLELPISPVTLAVIVVTLTFLTPVLFPPKSKATAHHILLEGGGDDDDLQKKRAEELKKEIGNSFDKFQEQAAKVSKCPSGKSGGLLGEFPQGSMVPPFDKVVFDPESPLQTVLGPVQTQFGYHLIWIQKRNLVIK